MSDLSTDQIEVEQLQNHFEDIAWSISKYDEAKDVYERLDWARKVLGRMHPDEVESLFKNLPEKMMRFATLALCIHRAYSPIWSGYVDYGKPMQREQPNQLILALPGWVISQLPPKFQGQRRSDYESLPEVKKVMTDFFKLATPTEHPDYEYTFQISSSIGYPHITGGTPYNSSDSSTLQPFSQWRPNSWI